MAVRMWSRRLSSAALLRASVALGLAWSACAAATPSGTEGGQARDVRAWLSQIHAAASRQNYQGTFVISGGGNVASARMAHFCEGSNQYERVESLDGQARNVYRNNDVVHTVWPASRIAVVEQRGLLTSFPALLQAGADRISDWYELQPAGEERIAGREAQVLVVKARDSYRYGYRLWSDKASRLLLRVDVLGERGDVLETAAFSDVSVGVHSQPETVLQPMRRLEGYRVLRPAVRATGLDAEGWTLRTMAPGFRQVSCVRREMENAGDAEVTGSAPQVLQAIFADGLTYVSVFVEPYKPKQHVKPMLASIGATQTLSLRQGEWWITVVGDAPAATLRIFADNLVRKN
jgi:sigma-E factor negative regulatory protein RseB